MLGMSLTSMLHENSFNSIDRVLATAIPSKQAIYLGRQSPSSGKPLPRYFLTIHISFKISIIDW